MMTTKILFLDFDGVMIPTRAYWLEGQTRPVSKFDPSSVSLLNKVCEEMGLKIVVVSSWRRTAFAPNKDLRQHMIEQGVKKDFIHDDHSCPYKPSSSKYSDVNFWLEDHPEVTEYIIVDDDLHDEYAHKGKIISPLFDDGFTFKEYVSVSRHFGGNPKIVY